MEYDGYTKEGIIDIYDIWGISTTCNPLQCVVSWAEHAETKEEIIVFVCWYDVLSCSLTLSSVLEPGYGLVAFIPSASGIYQVLQENQYHLSIDNAFQNSNGVFADGDTFILRGLQPDLVYDTQCSHCAAGRFKNFTENKYCRPCGVDHFSHDAGAALCVPCAENMATDSHIGQTHCVCTTGYEDATLQDDTEAVVEMTVTLATTLEEFDSAAQQVYTESVAETAEVSPDDVTIVSIEESNRRRRMLLSAGIDVKTEIQVQPSMAESVKTHKLTIDNLKAKMTEKNFAPMPTFKPGNRPGWRLKRAADLVTQDLATVDCTQESTPLPKYGHIPCAFVFAENIIKHTSKTVAECEVLCDNEPTCVGFEMYNYNGGTATDYAPGDCQLSSGSTAVSCMSHASSQNLDFYVKLTNTQATFLDTAQKQAVAKTGVTGWRLVRYLPPTATEWHPATDNLQGTDMYGTAFDFDNAWSVEFGTARSSSLDAEWTDPQLYTFQQSYYGTMYKSDSGQWCPNTNLYYTIQTGTTYNIEGWNLHDTFGWRMIGSHVNIEYCKQKCAEMAADGQCIGFHVINHMQDGTAVCFPIREELPLTHTWGDACTKAGENTAAPVGNSLIDTGKFYAICCDDNGFQLRKNSANQCWSGAGGQTVDGVNYGLPVTSSEAVALCDHISHTEGVEARMCTKNELLSSVHGINPNRGCAGGCSLDDTLVWTIDQVCTGGYSCSHGCAGFWRYDSGSSAYDEYAIGSCGMDAWTRSGITPVQTDAGGCGERTVLASSVSNTVHSTGVKWCNRFSTNSEDPLIGADTIDVSYENPAPFVYAEANFHYSNSHPSLGRIDDDGGMCVFVRDSLTAPPPSTPTPCTTTPTTLQDLSYTFSEHPDLPSLRQFVTGLGGTHDLSAADVATYAGFWKASNDVGFVEFPLSDDYGYYEITFGNPWSMGSVEIRLKGGSISYNGGAIHTPDTETGVSGWRLVRYVPAEGMFHPVNDNLKGDGGVCTDTTTCSWTTGNCAYTPQACSEYGDANDFTKPWSVAFGTHDQFVLGTCDLAHWAWVASTNINGGVWQNVVKGIFSGSDSVLTVWNRDASLPYDYKPGDPSVILGSVQTEGIYVYREYSSLSTKPDGKAMCVFARDSTDTGLVLGTAASGETKTITGTYTGAPMLRVSELGGGIIGYNLVVKMGPVSIFALLSISGYGSWDDHAQTAATAGGRLPTRAEVVNNLNYDTSMNHLINSGLNVNNRDIWIAVLDVAGAWVEIGDHAHWPHSNYKMITPTGTEDFADDAWQPSNFLHEGVWAPFQMIFYMHTARLQDGFGLLPTFGAKSWDAYTQDATSAGGRLPTRAELISNLNGDTSNNHLINPAVNPTTKDVWLPVSDFTGAFVEIGDYPAHGNYKMKTSAGGQAYAEGTTEVSIASNQVWDSSHPQWLPSTNIYFVHGSCAAGTYLSSGVCTNCPAPTIESLPGSTAITDCYYYTMVDDQAIQGYNHEQYQISAGQTVSVEHCKEKCVQRATCKSFDYKDGDAECNLADVSCADAGSACKTYTDFKYYEITRYASGQRRRRLLSIPTSATRRLLEHPASCLACMPGFFKTLQMDHYTQLECVQCGTCAGNTQVQTVCNTTHNITCRACQANSVSDPGRAALGPCLCNPGYYLVGEECVQCPLNTYKEVRGNVPCVQCDATFVTTQLATTSSDLCLCPPGKRMLVDGSACVLCPNNTYQDTASHNTECTACRSDSSSFIGSTSLTDCRCNARFYPEIPASMEQYACKNFVAKTEKIKWGTTRAWPATAYTDAQCDSIAETNPLFGWYRNLPTYGSGMYHVFGSNHYSWCYGCYLRAHFFGGLCHLVSLYYGEDQLCYNDWPSATPTWPPCVYADGVVDHTKKPLNLPCITWYDQQRGEISTRSPYTCPAHCNQGYQIYMPRYSWHEGKRIGWIDTFPYFGLAYYTYYHFELPVGESWQSSIPVYMIQKNKDDLYDYGLTFPFHPEMRDSKYKIWAQKFLEDESTFCAECPVDTYKSDDANGLCTPCPAYSTSPTGSLTEADCKCMAGYFRNNSECVACPVGTYKAEVSDASACTSCPSTFTTAQTASASLDACVCAPGQAFLGDGNMCVDCAVDSYQSEYGKFITGYTRNELQDCRGSGSFYDENNVKKVNVPGSPESCEEYCNEYADCAGFGYDFVGGLCHFRYGPMPGTTYDTTTRDCYIKDAFVPRGCVSCAEHETSFQASISVDACVCKAGYHANYCPPEGGVRVWCDKYHAWTGGSWNHGNIWDASTEQSMYACVSDAVGSASIWQWAVDSRFEMTSRNIKTWATTAGDWHDCADAAKCMYAFRLDPGQKGLKAGDYIYPITPDPRGLSCLEGTGGCSACEVGKYKNQNSDTLSCEGTCPANSNSLPGSDSVNDCVCNQGFVADSADTTVCNQCEAGKFNDRANQTECFECVTKCGASEPFFDGVIGRLGTGDDAWSSIHRLQWVGGIGSDLGFSYDDDLWQHWTYGNKDMARHNAGFKPRAEALWQLLIADLTECSTERLQDIKSSASSLAGSGFGNVYTEQQAILDMAENQQYQNMVQDIADSGSCYVDYSTSSDRLDRYIFTTSSVQHPNSNDENNRLHFVEVISYGWTEDNDGITVNDRQHYENTWPFYARTFSPVGLSNFMLSLINWGWTTAWQMQISPISKADYLVNHWLLHSTNPSSLTDIYSSSTTTTTDFRPVRYYLHKGASGSTDTTKCPGLCRAPAGYEVNANGDNVLLCPNNTYQDGNGTVCLACPTSYTSAAGSAECTAPDDSVDMAVELPYTVEEFDEAAQANFVDGVAESTGVASEDVTITNIEGSTARRRLLSTGIQVDFKIQVRAGKAPTQVAQGLSQTRLNQQLRKRGLRSVKAVLRAPQIKRGDTNTVEEVVIVEPDDADLVVGHADALDVGEATCAANTVTVCEDDTTHYNDGKIRTPVAETGVCGWRLVRYMPQYAVFWHPVDDNLQGNGGVCTSRDETPLTLDSEHPYAPGDLKRSLWKPNGCSVYGDANVFDGNEAHWSVAFGTFDQLVIGKCDLTEWIWTTADDVVSHVNTGDTYIEKTALGMSKNLRKPDGSQTFNLRYRASQWYEPMLKNHAMTDIFYFEAGYWWSSAIPIAPGGSAMCVFVRDSATASTPSLSSVHLHGTPIISSPTINFCAPEYANQVTGACTLDGCYQYSQLISNGKWDGCRQNTDKTDPYLGTSCKLSSGWDGYIGGCYSSLWNGLYETNYVYATGTNTGISTYKPCCTWTCSYDETIVDPALCTGLPANSSLCVKYDKAVAAYDLSTTSVVKLPSPDTELDYGQGVSVVFRAGTSVASQDGNLVSVLTDGGDVVVKVGVEAGVLTLECPHSHGIGISTSFDDSDAKNFARQCGDVNDPNRAGCTVFNYEGYLRNEAQYNIVQVTDGIYPSCNSDFTSCSGTYAYGVGSLTYVAIDLQQEIEIAKIKLVPRPTGRFTESLNQIAIIVVPDLGYDLSAMTVSDPSTSFASNICLNRATTTEERSALGVVSREGTFFDLPDTGYASCFGRYIYVQSMEYSNLPLSEIEVYTPPPPRYKSPHYTDNAPFLNAYAIVASDSEARLYAVDENGHFDTAGKTVAGCEGFAPSTTEPDTSTNYARCGAAEGLPGCVVSGTAPYYAQNELSTVVDNDIGTSHDLDSLCYETREENPHVTVDLGMSQDIGVVYVFAADNDLKIGNFDLYAGNNADYTQNTKCAANVAEPGFATNYVAIVPCAQNARYVTVMRNAADGLTICEIQVYTAKDTVSTGFTVVLGGKSGALEGWYFTSGYIGNNCLETPCLQTCDDKCESLGLVADAGKLHVVDSEAMMQASVAAGHGSECTSYEAVADSPSQNVVSKKCYFWDGSAETTTNIFDGESRFLCYCKESLDESFEGHVSKPIVIPRALAANEVTAAIQKTAQYSGMHPVGPSDRWFTFDSDLKSHHNPDATAVAPATLEPSGSEAVYTSAPRARLYALQLASAQHLQVPVATTFDWSYAWTLTLWVRVHANTTGVLLYTNTSTQTDLVQTQTASADVWTHLALVHDTLATSGTAVLFVNGKSLDAMVDVSTLTIGGYLGILNADVDDVRVFYDHAFALDDIIGVMLPTCAEDEDTYAGFCRSDVPCSAGYEMIAFAYCQLCPAGKFQPDSDHWTEICQDCPMGKYSAVGGATGCTTCPVNTFTLSAGSTLCNETCSAGYGEINGALCQECPAGKFQPLSNHMTETCQDCPAGKYSDVSGARACTMCAANTFASSSGSTSCTGTCLPPNYYSPEGYDRCLWWGHAATSYSLVQGQRGHCTGYMSADVSDCTFTVCEAQCNAKPGCVGFFSHWDAATDSISNDHHEACYLCTDLIITPLENWFAFAAPSSCPYGHALGAPQVTNGPADCEQCPVNTYQDELHYAGSCKTCNAGSISAVGSASCTLVGCGPGQAYDNDVCTDCPANTYQDESSYMGTCKLCPANSVSTAGSNTADNCTGM
jgi:hypothetical protein